MGNVEVEGALERLAAETSVSRLLRAAATELVDLHGASRAVISKVIGDLIVELSSDNRSGTDRPLELFLLSDYPLTQELLDAGETRIVHLDDPTADLAEKALLAKLGFESLLLAPLRSRGKAWGLVEVYRDARGFEPSQAAVTFALVDGVGELLADLESAS